MDTKNALLSLSSKQLQKAAALKERIEQLQSELEAALGNASSASETKRTGAQPRVSRPATGGISRRASGRRDKKGNEDGMIKPASGPFRMSPAARAKIAAAARRRWAKAKASGRNRL
jgi:hypothetical protein